MLNDVLALVTKKKEIPMHKARVVKGRKISKAIALMNCFFASFFLDLIQNRGDFLQYTQGNFSFRRG